jgi:hypothetical protein
MPITAFSDPVVGNFDPADSESGPCLYYSGYALGDPRPFYSYHPGQNFGSPTTGWNANTRITTINAIPMTLSSTIIAAAAHTVGGTAMTLASANADGIAVGVSIQRADTGATVKNLLKLDPLVASVVANLTLGSNIMTVTSVNAAGGHCYNQLCAGMVLTDATTAGNLPTGVTITGWAAAGPAGGNSGTGGGLVGTYILSANALATATGDTITGLYTGTATNAVSTVPFGGAGTIQCYNPGDMISRAVKIVSTTSQVVQTFTVNGLDVYGFPMTELITTVGTSATTTNGKKAFKYILSVTPSVTDATGNYSVGTQDVVGFPMRSDAWQQAAEYDVSIMWNNTAVAVSTNYVAAVLTTATNATGDVRGTYGLTTAASNGTLRLITTQTPLVPNLGSAVGLFGQTQFASF